MDPRFMFWSDHAAGEARENECESLSGSESLLYRWNLVVEISSA